MEEKSLEAICEQCECPGIRIVHTFKNISINVTYKDPNDFYILFY